MNYQVWKEIQTASLGMKLTSVVCKLEIIINLSKFKNQTSPLFQVHMHHQMCNLALIEINMHHQMWNRAPTPTPHTLPART